jgi:hypothetical protein
MNKKWCPGSPQNFRTDTKLQESQTSDNSITQNLLLNFLLQTNANIAIIQQQNEATLRAMAILKQILFEFAKARKDDLARERERRF